MGNNIGGQIGTAAEGIGVGAASYELAKNAPQAYAQLQIWGYVFMAFFIILIIVAILLAIYLPKSSNPPTPPTSMSTNTNKPTSRPVQFSMSASAAKQALMTKYPLTDTFGPVAPTIGSNTDPLLMDEVISNAPRRPNFSIPINQ